MDEKMLEEIRNQEEISKAAGVEFPGEGFIDENEVTDTLQAVDGDNRQTTLFGGEA